ncbi:hypothetical protein CENSYa_0019 [Cenarchaeum symbiosum A]|uniref:Uncharacterized protein n=1 Tax=Cenarchaeum symbiosum (strain A) TaxID=414004 RepID=A0RTL0_CENSY|nr:hypothetical protein CENSYa_0019 [Cenarchaeum symbiosum A]
MCRGCSMRYICICRILCAVIPGVGARGRPPMPTCHRHLIRDPALFHTTCTACRSSGGIQSNGGRCIWSWGKWEQMIFNMQL